MSSVSPPEALLAVSTEKRSCSNGFKELTATSQQDDCPRIALLD